MLQLQQAKIKTKMLLLLLLMLPPWPKIVFDGAEWKSHMGRCWALSSGSGSLKLPNCGQLTRQPAYPDSTPQKEQENLWLIKKELDAANYLATSVYYLYRFYFI